MVTQAMVDVFLAIQVWIFSLALSPAPLLLLCEALRYCHSLTHLPSSTPNSFFFIFLSLSFSTEGIIWKAQLLVLFDGSVQAAIDPLCPVLMSWGGLKRGVWHF